LPTGRQGEKYAGKRLVFGLHLIPCLPEEVTACWRLSFPIYIKENRNIFPMNEAR
jgi:hypothetical protein